ncbi:hypothetical protein LIER_39665 [Lithospermum erythrorhizon]|uniref:Uncharacterized protein n=1 Tax=Lithospermum erythrorhizon TaxID=34254 RepID=A0AAV3QJV5_LITER
MWDWNSTMCSSGSVFPVNLVNTGSFIPAGMTALRVSGQKGARPASSVLVSRSLVRLPLPRGPLSAATRLPWPLWEAMWLRHLVLQLHGDCAALLPARSLPVPGEYVYRSPPGWMTPLRGSLPLVGGGATEVAALPW